MSGLSKFIKPLIGLALAFLGLLVFGVIAVFTGVLLARNLPGFISWLASVTGGNQPQIRPFEVRPWAALLGVFSVIPFVAAVYGRRLIELVSGRSLGSVNVTSSFRDFLSTGFRYIISAVPALVVLTLSYSYLDQALVWLNKRFALHEALLLLSVIGALALVAGATFLFAAFVRVNVIEKIAPQVGSGVLAQTATLLAGVFVWTIVWRINEWPADVVLLAFGAGSVLATIGMLFKLIGAAWCLFKEMDLHTRLSDQVVAYISR